MPSVIVMNSLLRLSALALTVVCFFPLAQAEVLPLDTHEVLNATPNTASDYSTAGIDTTEVRLSKDTPTRNDDIWKYKRKFMVGYTTGTLDQKKRFGGEISSRWGASIISGYNIYLHRKAIGGFLKFGLNIDANLNYVNFAKGSGKISDIMHPDDSDSDNNDTPETVSLGRHYLTSGLAIGPTATFAPFYASKNKNLASLKFRPYFHVVPSFATYIVSDDDDTEFHNAFALWCAAGMEIQWKRLIVGLEWKGSTAKYKGMLDELASEIEDGYESQGSHKFDMNMFNFSIGFAF